MSHFTRVKTQMVDKTFLLAALRDLGYTPQEGAVEIRGFRGQQTAVDIRVPTPDERYDIGFRLVDGVYELVADWGVIKGLTAEAFQQQLKQRYAYHAAKAKLTRQGFNLVNETVEADGQIKLVLRRMA